MNSDKSSKLRLLLTVGMLIAVCLLLYSILESTQRFVYYYREQQQIFLFDRAYILGLLKPIGGLAVMVGQWLVQFFVLPHTGAWISTLLSLVFASFIFLSLRKLDAHGCWWVPLVFIPVLLYNICLQENHVHYDGLVALTFGGISLWGYSLLTKTHWAYRVIGGVVIGLVLFYLAGSVAVLISLSMLLFDLLRKAPKAYLGIVPLAVVLFMGILAVSFNWLMDYDYAFWTKGYCEYYYAPTTLHTLSWISLPLLMLLVGVSAKWQWRKTWMEPVLAVVLIGLMTFGYLRVSNGVMNHAYYTLQEQIHYADTQEWDKLTTVKGVSANDDIQMNYFNLGLSHQGRLLNDLLIYPQKGMSSLMIGDVQDTDMSVLMARLYYQMGIIGAAQYLSFCATVGITYGNPSMTKLLIKTYLINGSYQMAEKYIKMLEKSWYYADWANEQRKFLYNDKAVEADPELGMMRRGLSMNSDEFVIIHGPLSDLTSVLDTNPDNQKAAEYLIGMLLVSKNFDGVIEFVERYYGKGCLTSLPDRLQEAVVAIAEHDPDYCRAHGVSEETIDRFSSFRQDVITLRRNGASNFSGLAAKYGKTFWYYMLK